jgi:hypothetical protein
MTGAPIPALSRRLRADLAAVGLVEPTLAPLDTGWGTRDGLYLVRDGDRRVVLKRIESEGHDVGSIVRRITKRVAMRREIRTYLTLERGRWEHLRHPQLLATDRRTYLVLSFVDAAPRWPDDVGSRVVRALLEFQVGLAGASHTSHLWHLARPSSPGRVLLRTATAHLRRGTLASLAPVARVASRTYFEIVRAGAPRCAQHGDLTYGNVIVEHDGGIHLVDLERARFSARLAFGDAVQLAADRRLEDGFDPAILREYARMWRRHHDRSVREACGQLRLALLLHVLYVLHRYPASSDVERLYQRFLGTILSSDRFGRWAVEHEIWSDDAGSG